MSWLHHMQPAPGTKKRMAAWISPMLPPASAGIFTPIWVAGIRY